MNKIILSYFIAAALFVLLGVNIASIVMAPMYNFHDRSGLLLILTSLAHCALHHPWFQAATSRRISGKIHLVANSIVTFTLLLTAATGLAALVKPAARELHEVAGVIVLLGLLAHGAHHLRWMAAMSGRLFGGDREHSPQIPKFPPESLP